ncbi:MAG: MBL fold metallo-hydrolase [Clostridia bacterium]|nr:MBL fold metallo-hydrolase [Clostridia bacterium]
MTITIHRGQKQIGGSIIEIATADTRIVFDVGINLDEGNTVTVPQIEGMFAGGIAFDAVFVSHYHADHMGLLAHILPGIPIYMGEKAFKIVEAANDYRGVSAPFEPEFLYSDKTVIVGDISVTPILCDHSAFDAYMFVVEADGKKVLYTGDFRANGRLDFDSFFDKLPEVDAVIIEGTTLSRDENKPNIEEEFLEDIAEGALQKYTGPAFIMMSAMNIDRIVTAYNAAQHTNRLFLEDIYTAGVATAAGEDIPQPNSNYNVRVFTTGGDKQYRMLQRYGTAKIGKAAIVKQPFLMCVRPSMKRYLAKLNELCPFENGILFYGMWKGYMDEPDVKDFLDFMAEKGVKLHILHTSGHADSMSIERVIAKTKPRVIVPVHTENDEWFGRFDGVTVVYECNHFEI